MAGKMKSPRTELGKSLYEEEEKSLEQLLAELSSKKGDIDWGELEDRRRADRHR
jgi:hypothetical protein